jgi:hypothetical protein
VKLLIAVGGPRLDVGPGGWDLWPVVGALAALWIGRRFLGLRWAAPLWIGAIASSLTLPILVHAWGLALTLLFAALLTVGLRRALVVRRAGGRDPSV